MRPTGVRREASVPRGCARWLVSQGIEVNGGTQCAALLTAQAHIRVTCVLVSDSHDQLAGGIADAAQTVNWGARAW